AIAIPLVVNVRDVEKDEDLGGLEAELLGGGANPAIIDRRAVGGDAEIPYRLALLGGIARHQTDETLLVGHAQRLGEGIADGKNGGLALVVLAGGTIARPEAVTVGLKVIENI